MIDAPIASYEPGSDEELRSRGRLHAATLRAMAATRRSAHRLAFERQPLAGRRAASARRGIERQQHFMAAPLPLMMRAPAAIFGSPIERLRGALPPANAVVDAMNAENRFCEDILASQMRDRCHLSARARAVILRY